MIQHIVVVGSGVMGKGIAYVAALAGYEVTLVDNNEVALKNAGQDIANILDKELSYGKVTPENRELVQKQLKYEHYLTKVAATADLIIARKPVDGSLQNTTCSCSTI